MKKAIIIADYGKETGMGHLMRCSALAKELSSDFDVCFISEENEYFDYIKKTAELNGVKAEQINDVANIGDEIEADVLIMDSYKNTLTFLTAVKNSYGLCVVVDDNQALPFYDVDVIINQNIGAEKSAYTARKDTGFLLGSKYAMISNSFTSMEPIDISKAVKNIVITMGGADLKNATEKVLNLVRKHKNYTYHVAVGSRFVHTDSLVALAKEAGNIVLHHNADMAELFSMCQGAITACGSTVYELAVLGVPSVGIITADNQRGTSITMEDEGIILCAGLLEKLSDTYFDILFSDITENKAVRADMHRKQLNAVARDGTKRIKEYLLSRL